MADELFPITRHALLHRIATAQTEGRAPSVVGAVVRDGSPVWIGSRSCVDGHQPDGDTQYRIGSISKTFVAVQVMRLREFAANATTARVKARLLDEAAALERMVKRPGLISI